MYSLFLFGYLMEPGSRLSDSQGPSFTFDTSSFLFDYTMQRGYVNLCKRSRSWTGADAGTSLTPTEADTPQRREGKERGCEE
jgi:hypothetical protein